MNAEETTDPLAERYLIRLREYMAVDPRRDKDKAEAAGISAALWHQYKTRSCPSLIRAGQIMASLGYSLAELEGPAPSPWRPAGPLHGATPQPSGESSAPGA